METDEKRAGQKVSWQAYIRELAICERRILEERAQGNLSKESEDRILDVMDRLWREMTREERAVIDEETGRRQSMERPMEPESRASDCDG